MPHRTDPDALTRSFLARLEQEHRGQENLRARTTAVRAGIKGGQVNRLNKNWQPARQSANRALKDSPLLLARARDLAWNEPYVGAAIEEIAKNVVGCGIQSAAAVASDDPDGFDDEFNSEADLAWQDWADNWCDATGEMTFDELLAVLLKEVVEAGEVFLLEINDPNPERPVPMAFQVVEPEQLDESRDRVAGPGVNKIDRGIEFDAQGRRVAYYFYDEHPDEAPALTKSTRYPAERVIHLYRPRRANQSRGATWLHLLIQTLKDMGWYLENELQGSAVAALFTVLIKRANGAGSGVGLNPESGEATDA
ncbi:MAG TPA: phage portal protein, partial [Pirellulales bacterium]